MVPRWFLALVVGGCGASVAHPVPISVISLGDRGALGPLVARDGLAPHAIEVPSAPPQADDPATALLARARAAYAQGELDTCRTELATIRISALLAAGDRTRAARALALDIACASAATQHAEARAGAERFASLGLEVVDSTIAPDVEALIGSAVEAANRAPRVGLAVTSVAGARLVVDGRPAECQAPCRLALAPGEHVVAAFADGFVPAHEVVRLPDTDHVALVPAPASGVLAAQQWRQRLGRGQPASDDVGARLLGRFVPEPRVAVIQVGARLEGALIVGGVRVARAEAPAGDVRGLLRELAYEGGIVRRPAVWQRPWFWIATSAAVVVLAGTVVALTYEPPVSGSVGF